MVEEQNLTAYRERLLKRVQTGSRRSTRRPSDPLQLFINDQRVGELNRGGSETTVHSHHAVPIHTVHLRSEDGVLLGGLVAPEQGFKTTRITLGRETVDLNVRNHARGGSVNAVFTPSLPLWQRVHEILSRAGRHQTSASIPGIRTMAVTQALVVFVLLGLATDRMTGWISSDRTRPIITAAQAPWVASLAEVEKVERRLIDVMKMQTKALDTMQTQQKNLVQLQGTVSKLISAQESVASGVVTVQREIEKRGKDGKEVGREVDRMSRLLMSQTQNAQEELQAEIHSLTIANDKLSKERLELERSNQELKQQLKAAGRDVSKITPSKAGSGDLAQRWDEPVKPQISEGHRSQDHQPFIFWVTFQEGTSEDSIERLFREVQGQKGSMTEGWQAVEILHPTESPDRFLDRISQAKIVKAVRTIERR